MNLHEFKILINILALFIIVNAMLSDAQQAQREGKYNFKLLLNLSFKTLVFTALGLTTFLNY